MQSDTFAKVLVRTGDILQGPGKGKKSSQRLCLSPDLLEGQIASLSYDLKEGPSTDGIPSGGS